MIKWPLEDFATDMPDAFRFWDEALTLFPAVPMSQLLYNNPQDKKNKWPAAMGKTVHLNEMYTQGILRLEAINSISRI